MPKKSFLKDGVEQLTELPLSLKDQQAIESLQQWFLQSARKLPWRETKDPYCIWVSEIILQQTRVVQGMQYYLRFIEAFPTVQNLAEAPLDDVLLLWQGLGYYSRARNMHKAAHIICNEYGQFPSDYNAIRALPGVGDYTAGAIASFAFALPYPAVDGNVLRVLSRYYLYNEPVDVPKNKALLSGFAKRWVQVGDPAIVNQALMELGATVCMPHKAVCEECPLQSFCCLAFDPLAVQLPIKSKRLTIKQRNFYFMLIRNSKGCFAIEQRMLNDIWKNLFQLPLLEASNKLTNKKLEASVKEQLSLFGNFRIKDLHHETLHKLTHQTLHIRFLLVDVEKEEEARLPQSWKWITPSELGNFAFPIPLVKAFNWMFSEQEK